MLHFYHQKARQRIFALRRPLLVKLMGHLLFHEVIALDAKSCRIDRLGVLVWWHQDLLLASADPEMAQVLGRPLRRIELMFVIVAGMSVSVGTMSVGPMMLFGLLVLPPMGARPFARSMRGLLWKSAGLGGLGSLLGLVAAFRIDLPPAPCVVAASAVCAVPGWLAAGWRSKPRTA